MKTHLALAGILTLLVACSHEGKSPSSKRDWGTGLNTVERKYAKPAPETVDAAVAALKSYDLKVDSDRHDEFGGEIIGHRADGRKVTIKVEALDANNSRASVRVDPGDSHLSQMIHERMADKLGMGSAKPALLGGNTEDFPYDADLATGVQAAERVADTLGYTVTAKEVKDDWATIDARAEDSTPVRIKVERVKNDEFPLKVTFVAGRGKTEESKSLIGKMHDEFDRQIGGHVK
jgi:hypothetical protein